MKRSLVTAVLLGLLASAASGQTVKVKVRGALYDRDLNLKPVPHLSLKLIPSTAGQQPIAVQTSLDGLAEVDLPAGKYKIISEKPVELFDKSYRWELEAEFVKPENTLELSNDNAQITAIAGERNVRVDELAFQYKRVKDAVVTVWTERGQYDGLIVDPAGLVLTAWRPLDAATWLAVQVDDRRRLAATVVASDKDRDVALLRINPRSGDLEAAQLSTDPGSLLEGERVFTVEAGQREKEKKLITGVVSKADNDEIVTDIAASYGSPLFNSSGNVVGLARHTDRVHIRPIAIATSVLAEAKQKIGETAAPSGELLPVFPSDYFPSDALRAPGRGRWEKDVYSFKAGDFFVEFITPISEYETSAERYEASLKEYGKHPQGRTKPSEPENKFEPLLGIAIVPKTKTPFWENMAKNSNSPVILRYKTGFKNMRLLCGEKEVTPIWPGHVVAGSGYGRNVVLVDESSMGRYIYPYDSISPQCGKVSMQIFSAKEGEPPLEKILEADVVKRIWQDFEPYRKLQSQNAVGGPK